VAEDPNPPDPGAFVVRPYFGRANLSVSDNNQDSGDTVRAFVITGGRATSDIKLDFQAMLSVVPDPARNRPALRLERAKLVESCVAEPLSVAEVAVRLGVAIGVIQVLAGDLVSEGYLKLHSTDSALLQNIAFLERLSHGIRAL
jgi:Protein of unknown function (DUF742)